MSDEREVIFEDEEEDARVPQNDEEMMWSHEVLNQFELLVDTLGISTVMFLMSEEHEAILNSWVKEKVDIQNRRKQ